MESVKSVSTPIAQHFRLFVSQSPKTDEERKFMSKIPYASMVGSIMYAMVCSRPDLTFAVSLVSRFMGNHGKLTRKP